MIPGGRPWILTNAHVVSEQRAASVPRVLNQVGSRQAVIRVQKHGSSVKTKAKVLCIGFDCDSALLSVEDDDFWKDLPLVNLNDSLPELYETVNVIGYPLGITTDTICCILAFFSMATIDSALCEACAKLLDKL